MDPPPGAGGTVLDPTITTQDVTDYDNTFAIVDGYRRPALNEGSAPSGTLNFNGQVDARLPVSDDPRVPFETPVVRMIGDLDVELEVRHISGENNFRGTADNFNIIENGIPVEAVDGSLVIAGAYNAGLNGRQRLLRTAGRGALTSTFGLEDVGMLNLTMTMDGRLRVDPDAQYGAIAGTVGGSGNGDYYTARGTGTFYILEDGVPRP
ncbi:hypothetical protein [Yoonia sp. 208BN28-4]|uniref:hypothetical protein n=1 Tax=Yoonia sp. 208BN28-4 TaxID=3126505 RepID=UPI0030EF6E17